MCTLDNVLKEAWNNVYKNYEAGKIASEATLQYYLSQELEKELGKTYKIYQCPSLAYKSYDNDPIYKKIPDIVVIKDTQIEMLFELKFVPQSCPGTDDVRKLEEFHENKGKITRKPFFIEIDPYTGRFTKNNDGKKKGKITFTDDALFVFAAVGRGYSEAVQPIESKIPERYFRHLYIRTYGIEIERGIVNNDEIKKWNTDEEKTKELEKKTKELFEPIKANGNDVQKTFIKTIESLLRMKNTRSEIETSKCNKTDNYLGVYIGINGNTKKYWFGLNNSNNSNDMNRSFLLFQSREEKPGLTKKEVSGTTFAHNYEIELESNNGINLINSLVDRIVGYL